MKRTTSAKETYTPTCLRAKKGNHHEAKFIVAALTHKGGFNVLETVDTLIEALEIVGPARGRILRTELDGTYEAIWKWKQDKWIKI